MICPNCNAPNRDGAKFCVGCGGTLVAPPPGYGQGYGAPSSPQAAGGYPPVYPPAGQAQAGWSPDYSPQSREPGRQCGQCGQQNVESARFCTRCGAAMPVASPGYLPGTPAGYPQQAQSGTRVQGRKRLRGWIIAGGVVVVLLLLGGIAWLASRQWLRMGTNETAQILPARPDAYLVINPGASQLARMADPSDLEILGLPLFWLGLVDPSSVTGLFDALDVDFDRDIKPWMGLEAAAAVYGLEDGDTALAVAIATRDQALSDEFLESVRDAMEDNGSEFDETSYRGIPITYELVGSSEGLSFATVNRLVVAASNLDTMESIVDASEDRTARLADDADYLALMDRLPGNRIGAVYLGEFGKVIADEINADWLPATQATGLSLSLESTGLRVDVVQEIDKGDLDGDALDSLQRPAAGDRIAEVVPGDALIVASGSDFSKVWRQLALDIPNLLHEDPDTALRNFQEISGVDLEDDVFSRLTGDYAVAVLDNGDRAVDWPSDPPVSFLLAFDVPADEQPAIDDAMQELVDGLESQGGWSAQSRSSGDSRVYTLADASGAKVAGYTLRDDTLLVAIGESAVETVVDPRGLPLAEEETYRQSMAPLPGDAQSVFFVDTSRLVRTIQNETGDYDGGTPRGSVVYYLKQLLSLSSASSPVDEDGYQSTVIYLQTSDR